MNHSEFAARISFDADRQIMDVDFSDFHFDNSGTVNRFYDHIEQRIAETGEDLWFFLVNLNGTRIDTSAWFDYARRGKALNLAHSMGSVRYDASEATRRQIERDADTEAFDPNLHPDRDAALRRIAALPSRRRARPVLEPSHAPAEYQPRIAFDLATQIMEVDFSKFTFHHSRDVDDVFDHIEQRIRDTGTDRWFFLINYEDCRILPGAWVRYAHRGKLLNQAHSMGSVRYAPGSETERDIRMRAESQDFRPNIRNTREEALERIEEMRAESTVA